MCRFLIQALSLFLASSHRSAAPKGRCLLGVAGVSLDETQNES